MPGPMPLPPPSNPYAPVQPPPLPPGAGVFNPGAPPPPSTPPIDPSMIAALGPMPQVPGMTPGILPNFGGTNITPQQAMAPFGGGFSPADFPQMSQALSNLSVANPGQNYPAHLPTPEEQEQAARPLPLKITHELGKGLEAINNALMTPADMGNAELQNRGLPSLMNLFGTAAGTAMGSMNSPATMGRNLIQGKSPLEQSPLDQQHDPKVQAEFERIYNEQGTLAGGRYLREQMDPTSRFLYETLGNPTTYLGWGGLESLGTRILANAGGDLGKLAIGHALIAADKSMGVPFDLGGQAVSKALDFAHAKPLFENLTKEGGPLYAFAPGSSARAKVEDWRRSAMDLLSSLRTNGWDQTTFNQATGDPWRASPFTGMTPINRAGWSNQWNQLRKQATSLEDPLAQVYATHLIDAGRQAEAFQASRVAAHTARIKTGDPGVLSEWGYGPGYEQELLQDLHNNLNSYVQSVQQGIGNRINSFQADAPDFLRASLDDAQKQAVTKTLADLHTNINGTVGQTRSSMDDLKSMIVANKGMQEQRTLLLNQIKPLIKAPGDPMDVLAQQLQNDIRTRNPVPSTLWHEQAKQHLINARNIGIDSHYNQAYQELADTITNGDVDKLHGLIGQSSTTDPVYRDLLTQLRTLRAQSLGQDAIVDTLPPQLGQWYKNAGLDRDLPGFIDRAVNDKNQMARILSAKNSEGVSHADDILQRLGMSPADIQAARASGQSFQQVAATKGITSLRDLLDKFQNAGSTLSNDEWTKLNALSSKYQTSGDLLHDDGLSLVGHQVVSKALQRYGPNAMQKKFGDLVPQIVKDMAQSYKERMLLSGSYHMIVGPQELLTGALHGIDPVEMGGYLGKAIKEAAGGHGPVPTLPGYMNRAMDMWDQPELPRAISSGGIAGNLVSRSTGLGGPADTLTATERLPGWAKTAVAVAHAGSMAASTGSPLVGALNLIPHLFLENKLMPGLIHTNADISRAVEVSLRSAPWFRAKSAYLDKAAPDFLDKLEQTMTDPHYSLSGDIPITPGPWMKNTVGIPNSASRLPKAGLRVPGPVEAPLNNLNAVRDSVDRLRGRGGFFSPSDVADVMSAHQVPTDVANRMYREWMGHLYQGDQEGIKFANHIHFDYGSPSQFEDVVSHIAPFYMWMFRLLPFMATHAAENPALAQAFGNAQLEIEKANRQAGRTQPQFNQQMDIPGTGGVASFLTGHPGSPNLQVNPFSAVVPGMGMFSGQGGSGDEPPVNQILNTMSGVGLETFPTIPLGLNTLQAGVSAMGGPQLYNEPAGGFSRQSAIYSLLNNALVNPAITGANVGGTHIPGLNEALGPMGDSNLNYPLSQLRLQDADPDYWWKVLSNLPNVATGQRPETFIDQATRKRIAEMSLEQTGTPNAPPYVQAMDQPNSPIYLQARAEAQRQENLLGAVRFMEPFTLRAQNPTEQVINQQRSQAQTDYGLVLSEIISHYLPSRYPLYNAYSRANSIPTSIYDSQHMGFPQGFTGSSHLVDRQALPELEQYLQFVTSYNIPPSLWWTPGQVGQWLQAKQAMQQMGDQLSQQSSPPINPLTIQSPVR